MAPERQGQPAENVSRQEELAAEWVNVGLSGGMFRPYRSSNGHANNPVEHSAEADSRLEINEADWQPHRRCCL
jgi:hypothetical protein